MVSYFLFYECAWGPDILLRFKEKNDKEHELALLKQKHKRLEDELGEAIKDKYNLDIEVHQCNSNVQRKNQEVTNINKQLDDYIHTSDVLRKEVSSIWGND